ncbi:hypothetical protein [Azospirillum sp.]|uniref:hypothetical protein n=1 Tax=Azospirillum sp. TaxID=34012 RepID=UPI002D6B6139|nr:hypothetical protein [Azospirillum sp.]HYD66182.1 hypothetical protein [Azospirillum sp.]
MKKHFAGVLIALTLFASAAVAQTINNLGAGRGSVIGADLFPSYQGANPAVRPSAAQIAAYVYSLASGDLTANGTGTHTLATVNSNVGSFGSATQCTSITVNAKGLITAASQAACTPAMSSVTGRATLAQLPQGIANSIWINPTGSTADMQNVAVPACANDGTHALVYVNGSGLACATLTGGGAASAVPSVQTGTNYAFQGTDLTKIIYLSNAAPQAPTIAQAGTGSFTSGWYATACNIGAGAQTITPTTSTIGGASTFVLPAGSAARPNCAGIVSDGTNYVVVPDFGMDASTFSAGTLAAARGGAGTISGALKGNGSGVVSQAACADLSNGTALCSTTPGTGVATAAAANLSAAGGLSTTVASGTSALGTSAISSATCATVVTTTATNTATTDVIWWGFNGDPTAVTGYVPLVAGMLTIIAYPSANNVNFKVCNNTSGSITPGAITLNWRVAR